ncbi:shikimate dehydrogenase [Thermodesulfobacteriota bacterium]
MIINQDTGLYGVVGSPIGHSLSPTMHNAAFLKTGVNAVYLAFETRDIEGCMIGMKALGIKGMSVTIPHKSDVIPLLDKVDELAKKIGAVNTIVNDGGRLVGYNSDAIGALRALEEKVEISGKSCLIIGAGGAARAIGYILKEKGVEVTVANRSLEPGKALSHSLGCRFIPLGDLGNATTDILINTTPVGMAPKKDLSIVPENVLKKGMVVMDIIYNPLKTKFLSMAEAGGCLTVNGLGMFIHQGVEQFRLWTGIEAPIRTMTEAVKEALGNLRHERD